MSRFWRFCRLPLKKVVVLPAFPGDDMDQLDIVSLVEAAAADPAPADDDWEASTAMASAAAAAAAAIGPSNEEDTAVPDGQSLVRTFEEEDEHASPSADRRAPEKMAWRHSLSATGVTGADGSLAEELTMADFGFLIDTQKSSAVTPTVTPSVVSAPHGKRIRTRSPPPRQKSARCARSKKNASSPPPARRAHAPRPKTPPSFAPPSTLPPAPPSHSELDMLIVRAMLNPAAHCERAREARAKRVAILKMKRSEGYEDTLSPRQLAWRNARRTDSARRSAYSSDRQREGGKYALNEGGAFYSADGTI